MHPLTASTTAASAEPRKRLTRPRRSAEAICLAAIVPPDVLLKALLLLAAIALMGCLAYMDLVMYSVANTTDAAFVVRVGRGSYEGSDFLIPPASRVGIGLRVGSDPGSLFLLSRRCADGQGRYGS